MNAIWNKILLFKQIRVESSFEDINCLISEMNQKEFGIKKLAHGEYKFLSNISLGTAIVQGNSGLIEGIKIYCKIIKQPDSTVLIRITSKLRIELIVISIVWLGVIFLQIFGNEEFPLWINIVLFPMVLLWFGFVYRVQEKALLKKVEKKIKRI